MPDDGDPFFEFEKSSLCAPFCKLPIIGQLPGLFCINKPAGVVTDAHPWYPKAKNIIEVLRLQLERGKTELAKLEMQTARSIFILDAEFSGAFLVAGTPEAVEHYRNAYGSGMWEFVFHLIVEKSEPGFAGEQTCAFPVKNNREGTGLRVSHRYGKQAKTIFKRLKALGDFELWEARASYYRLHQIRVHAQALGLRIGSETHYNDSVNIPPKVLNLRDSLKNSKKTSESLTFGGHLLEIKLPEMTFTAPYPDEWTAFLDCFTASKNA
jgi:23S rRNA-/tRNA-specific pseudouridylate synthase